MTEYRFYIRNGELACEFTRGSVTYFFDQNTAKKKLYNLSFEEYEDIKPNNNRIYFVKKKFRVVFDGFGSLFFKLGPYGGYNYVKKLVKAYMDYQIKRVGKKTKKASKKGVVKALCATAVATMLLANKEIQDFASQTYADSEIVEFDESKVFVEAASIVSPSVDHTNKYLVDLEKEVDSVIEKETKIYEANEVCSYDKPYLIDKIFNIDLECKEKGNSNDVLYVLDNFGPYLQAAALMYGIAPSLLTAVMTHESHGVHPENLMQIVFDAHIKFNQETGEYEDEVKKAYNFVTGEYEEFVLTYTPDKYKNEDGTYKCTVYTKEDLKDPEKNIKCGAAIFASYYQKYCGNNIFLALVCYNKGPGALQKILNETASTYNTSIEAMKNSPSDLTFLPTVHKNNTGDPNYIENVLQYNLSDEPIYMLAPPDDMQGNNIIYINKIYSKNNIM